MAWAGAGVKNSAGETREKGGKPAFSREGRISLAKGGGAGPPWRDKGEGGEMDWYQGSTRPEIAGQLLIALLFLGTGAINATTKVKQHLDRMVAMNVPWAGLVLWTGFVLQFVGGTMVAIDWRADIGALILILFTLVATAIFHRFWLMEDPLRRHLHLSFVFSNCAVIGGLLLLV